MAFEDRKRLEKQIKEELERQAPFIRQIRKRKSFNSKMDEMLDVLRWALILISTSMAGWSLALALLDDD